MFIMNDLKLCDCYSLYEYFDIYIDKLSENLILYKERD